MNSRKLSLSIFTFLLLTLICILGLLFIVPRNGEPLSVTVTIDGKEILATEGDVIAIGTRNAQGYCEFPPFEISQDGSGSGYASSTVYATRDCRLVVGEVIQYPEFVREILDYLGLLDGDPSPGTGERANP